MRDDARRDASEAAGPPAPLFETGTRPQTREDCAESGRDATAAGHAAYGARRERKIGSQRPGPHAEHLHGPAARCIVAAQRVFDAPSSATRTEVGAATVRKLLEHTINSVSSTSGGRTASCRVAGSRVGYEGKVKPGHAVMPQRLASCCRSVIGATILIDVTTRLAGGTAPPAGERRTGEPRRAHETPGLCVLPGRLLRTPVQSPNTESNSIPEA